MVNKIKEKSASVCCLVGIPGSGKSTIARAIIDLNHQRGSQKTLSSSTYGTDVSHFDDILLIDYDDLTRKELSLKHDNNRCGSSSFDSNELEAWRKSRRVAVEKLKVSLKNHFACGSDDASTLLIILDDNFHLRSMRREIYRSCQEIIAIHPRARMGFVVVYCSAPLDVCLRRNDLRSGKERIPRDVINRMAMGLESPDKSKAGASFERFHLSIDNSEDIADRNYYGRHLLSDLHRCLQESLLSPVLPKNDLSQDEIFELEQKRAREREDTHKSNLQRIDQLLRKLVGAVARIQKTKTEEANEIRKSILSMLRQNNHVDIIEEDLIVQQFACSILGGAEADRRNALSNTLAMAIHDVAQKFREDNS